MTWAVMVSSGEDEARVGRVSDLPAPVTVRASERQPGDLSEAGELAAGAPDGALVAQLPARDAQAEAALGALYDRHAGAVFGLLSRMLGHASAQEVTQDVFLRLWERPGAFEAGRGSVRAYLLVQARSRALDHLRARRGTLPLHTEDGQDLPLPDARPGPHQRSEAAQRRDQVRAALHALSEAHRDTVERAYLLGQTREEIAGAMGVPVGTVKSRLSYALKHLRMTLGEEVSAWLE